MSSRVPSLVNEQHLTPRTRPKTFPFFPRAAEPSRNIATAHSTSTLDPFSALTRLSAALSRTNSTIERCRRGGTRIHPINTRHRKRKDPRTPGSGLTRETEITIRRIRWMCFSSVSLFSSRARARAHTRAPLSVAHDATVDGFISRDARYGPVAFKRFTFSAGNAGGAAVFFFFVFFRIFNNTPLPSYPPSAFISVRDGIILSTSSRNRRGPSSLFLMRSNISPMKRLMNERTTFL